MRVALAQMGSVPGDFDSIVNRMLDVDRRAAIAGADLVVFPSTLLAGVYPVAVSASVAFELDLLDAIEDFASRATVSAAVPAYIYDGLRSYTEVFLCDGGVAGPLRLRASERMDAQVDADLIGATAHIEDVDVQFIVDGTPPEFDDAPDLIVACPCLPFCDEDPSTLLAGGLADAGLQGTIETAPCWLAVVAGVGGYDDAVLAGGSFAVDPQGTVVAACPIFEEGLALFDVPSSVDVKDSPEKPRLHREIPRTKGRLVTPTDPPTLVGMPAADVPELSSSQRTGMLWRALMGATRDYVRKSGFRDVLVGLTGDIDSAVVAALAVDALGSGHVQGVISSEPSFDEVSTSDAQALAQLLEIRTIVLPADDIDKQAETVYAAALGTQFSDAVRANLSARLFGLALMTLSNATGALVLNALNKTEAGMGLGALYGETVGTFSPLADVYQGRVYELARWRNGVGDDPIIPLHVLTKPPSMEFSLRASDDEGLRDASWRDIDRILYMHVERGLDAGDIAGHGIDGALVRSVLEACQRAEYKRHQESLGPIVSYVPFVDRGWPLVLGWHDRRTMRLVAHDDVMRDLGRLLGVELAAQNDTEANDEDEPYDAAVADRLQEMVGKLSHQDQIVGAVGDVAFGARLSGRGPEMDSVMGVPLFSKN